MGAAHPTKAEILTATKARSPKLPTANSASAKNAHSLPPRTASGKFAPVNQVPQQQTHLQKQQVNHAFHMQQLMSHQPLTMQAQRALHQADRSASDSGRARSFASPSPPPPQPLKRARSSQSREPEPKRARTAGASSSADARPATPRSAVPQSPTTSSRSRTRKRAAPESNGTHSVSASAAHAYSGAASAAAGGRARALNGAAVGTPKARPPQARQAASRNTILQQANVHLTVDGAPVPADVKPTMVVRRLFGQEIQCVMHAFGETRACARDTLELVEDAVRDAVRRVVVEAVAFARHEAAEMPSRAHGNLELEVRHVAHVIRRDARAMYRFNQTLKLAAESFSSRPNDAAQIRSCITNKATMKPWEAIAELAKLPNDTEPESDRLNNERQLMNDPWKYCTWKAYHMFRSLMPGPTFSDYVKCRSTNLVLGVSRSQFEKISNHPRIYVFQKWLDIPPTKVDVKMGLATMHALGHIAWECVGILTQTALIQKHFDDIAKGLGDPRAEGWTYARHILAALGHGIATAVLIPLSDTQLMYLRQEVERLPIIAHNTPDYLRGNARGSRSLLPGHIREALRRKDFSECALLNIMRGCYCPSRST